MEINERNLKIKIRFPSKQSQLLANAIVVVNAEEIGLITIKGFCIWVSKIFNDRLQESINITPPSVRSFGRYLPLVFIEDNKMWNYLEEQIYSAYLIAKQNKKQPMDESIDPYSIPDSI